MLAAPMPEKPSPVVFQCHAPVRTGSFDAQNATVGRVRRRSAVNELDID
jgi:hypothetical protein